MTVHAFRRLVLALKDAEEGAHMGHPDFRVGGRVFASLHGTPLRGMARLPLEEQARLIDAYPDVFEPEAGAWGRAGYTRVWIERATEEEAGEALTLAWRFAVALGPTRRKAPRPASKMGAKSAATRPSAPRARKTASAPKATASGRSRSRR